MIWVLNKGTNMRIIWCWCNYNYQREIKAFDFKELYATHIDHQYFSTFYYEIPSAGQSYIIIKDSRGINLDMHTYDVNRKEHFQRKQYSYLIISAIALQHSWSLNVAFCTDEEQAQWTWERLTEETQILFHQQGHWSHETSSSTSLRFPEWEIQSTSSRPIAFAHRWER